MACNSVYSPLVEECALATDLPWYRDTFYRHVCESGGGAVAASAEDADIVVIFERWAEKDAAAWAGILLDPFLARHAPKCYVVSHDDYTAGLMPGCYTSLTRAKFDPRWHRPCGYPNVYHWEPTLEELRVELATEVKWLSSFRGTLDSHRVRRRLRRVMANQPDGVFEVISQRFWSHSLDQRRDYVRQILESRFVLCPRGFSPSTHRMYETMQLGRCAVVLADDWIAPDGPDWSNCILRIAERDLASLPRRLAEAAPRALELGAAARREWLTWFDEAPRFRRLYQAIGELHDQQRGRPPRTIDVLRNRLREWRFRWNAGWSQPRHLLRRLWSRKG